MRANGARCTASRSPLMKRSYPTSYIFVAGVPYTLVPRLEGGDVRSEIRYDRNARIESCRTNNSAKLFRPTTKRNARARVESRRGRGGRRRRSKGGKTRRDDREWNEEARKRGSEKSACMCYTSRNVVGLLILGRWQWRDKAIWRNGLSLEPITSS